MFSKLAVMVVHSCHPPVEGKSTSDKTTYSLEEFSSTKESEILPPFDSDATLKSTVYFDEELVKIL